MSLFQRSDPDNRALIRYIVDRARDRGVTLNRTKLVKLLYLIDVERISSRRDPLTGFQWVFYHYGPYAFTLIDTLGEMEGTTLVASKYGDGIFYRAALDAPDGSDWPAATKSTVDHVVDEYGGMELNELLDHVYFHTGPMIDAQRGQPLDMTRALDYHERRRPPIAPAAAPTDISERLQRWRQSHSKSFAPVELDPPGLVLTDENEAEDVAVKGTLYVSGDVWI